jgi:hypothetical protein
MTTKVTGTGYTVRLTEGKGPVDIHNIDMKALNADIRKMQEQERAQAGTGGNKGVQGTSMGQLDKFLARNGGIFNEGTAKYLQGEAERISKETEAEEKKRTQTVAQMQRGNVQG